LFLRRSRTLNNRKRKSLRSYSRVRADLGKQNKRTQKLLMSKYFGSVCWKVKDQYFGAPKKLSCLLGEIRSLLK
jgi:hypothetical protein